MHNTSTDTKNASVFGHTPKFAYDFYHTEIGKFNRGESSAAYRKGNVIYVQLPPRDDPTVAQAKTTVELTVFEKIGGPLTKVISLAADGSVHSDGSRCKMSDGKAWRVVVDDVEHLANLINGLKSTQAITLGALRKDLPDEVKVTVKDKLNGEAGVIARDKEHITYRKGKPALALIDFDRAGMSAEMGKRIGDDFWGTLCNVLPGLRDAAYVIRRSTSAGLFNGDVALPSSGGRRRERYRRGARLDEGASAR
jgi:hypothetical protein